MPEPPLPPHSPSKDDDLRAVLPTPEDLARDYPSSIDWSTLRAHVASGDLGLLKRHPRLQIRCDEWYDLVKARYGSLPTYLITVRLGWAGLPLLPAPPYFNLDSPQDEWAILVNDWPYGIPAGVEHHLIWTRRPILPPDPRLELVGVWGFSGALPPPEDSQEPNERGAKFIGSGEQARLTRELVREQGAATGEFVKAHWSEDEWETAWFVNPPRLQSIPGLAHVHVFARKKERGDVAASFA